MRVLSSSRACKLSIEDRFDLDLSDPGSCRRISGRTVRWVHRSASEQAAAVLPKLKGGRSVMSTSVGSCGDPGRMWRRLIGLMTRARQRQAADDSPGSVELDIVAPSRLGLSRDTGAPVISRLTL
jgi:hypothetical protein